MWNTIGYERCLSYVNCQLGPAAASSRPRPSISPSITISRLTGSGGHSVAAKLAEYLQTCAPVDCHWTVFDRNLIETVMADHHLPKRIAEFMPENHRPMLRDMLEELLGLHPSSWTLVHYTMETIMRLAQMGYVILIGHGANLITSRLDNVFHVRLIASLDERIARVQEDNNLDRPTAREFIRQQDRGRRRYVKDHFGRDSNDPLLYHMVINLDRIAFDAAAQLIGDTVIHRFHLDQQEQRRGVRPPAALQPRAEA